jgi:N-acetyl-gamma-glutamyl-phosphate reductase
MHKIPVGVLGASGYTGRELCALVARHPRLALAWAAAHERTGDRMQVAGLGPVTFVAADAALLGEAELVFSALPHGASAPWVARARAAGAKVIDLSADLRPGQPVRSGSGAVAADAYGLPELERQRVRGASVVANPGCYATAVLLGLLPALARGLVAPDATISVAAASGVTGAGDAPKRELLFAEVTEDFRGYSVGNHHRHLPEMRAAVERFVRGADLVFTPHLLPVARGIIATMTVPVVAPVADPLALWREHYAGECFVEIADAPPALRDVVHRNVARVFAMSVVGVKRPTLLVIVAIDNLLKGAAGQAVQNANLVLGLGEAEGLPR